jgi:hypothetical protein
MYQVSSAHSELNGLHQFKKTISAMVTSGGAAADLQAFSGNQSTFSESGAASARSVGASNDFKVSPAAGKLKHSFCCSQCHTNSLSCSLTPTSPASPSRHLPLLQLEAGDRTISRTQSQSHADPPAPPLSPSVFAAACARPPLFSSPSSPTTPLSTRSSTPRPTLSSTVFL